MMPMKTWTLYWAPEGRPIDTVQAPTARAAVHKAPVPYKKYLGEVYATEVLNLMTREDKMKLKEELSRQIRGIENNGFAYLGPVLRVAIFGGDTIDWNAVHKEFLKQNPGGVV